MARWYVPDLARKLDLLVAYGHLPSKEAVAQAIGRSAGTIRGWIGGDKRVEPETVTDSAVPAVLAVFRDALGEIEERELRRLLEGLPEDLEELFAANAAPSLRALIDREANWSVGTVIREDGSRSLIRDRRKAPEPAEHRVALGQPFRIEFRAKIRRGFVVALQDAPGMWACAPVEFDRANGVVHLPGFEATDRRDAHQRAATDFRAAPDRRDRPPTASARPGCP